MVGGRRLHQGAIAARGVGSHHLVHRQVAVPVHAVQLAVHLVDPSLEGHLGQVHAGPGLPAAIVHRGVLHRRLCDGGGRPMAGRHVRKEAQGHQFIGLGAVPRPAQHPVEHRAGLCPGQAILRTEGPIGVAADPALGGSCPDGLGRPVGGGHVGEGGRPPLLGVHPQEQGHKFRPGNHIVGAEEGAVVKDAQGAQRPGRLGKPVAVGHIGVPTVAGAAVRIGQQAVQDLRRLGPGELGLRLEGPSREPRHVGHMVLAQGDSLRQGLVGGGVLRFLRGGGGFRGLRRLGVLVRRGHRRLLPGLGLPFRGRGLRGEGFCDFGRFLHQPTLHGQGRGNHHHQGQHHRHAAGQHSSLHHRSSRSLW